MMDLSLAGMTGLLARAAEPDLAAWTEECRLNPARGAVSLADDPRVQSAFMTVATQIGPAIDNLTRQIAGQVAAPVAG